MNNAEKILTALDRKLTASVELTLYGRAALFLGFEHPPAEYALSRDVDAVLWKGQAEMLLEILNFLTSFFRMTSCRGLSKLLENIFDVVDFLYVLQSFCLNDKPS